jgi:glycosyltransferase involved in cell wall biosynthesis
MDKPLVSIIVNNYNYGRFLHQAIDSALNQTYPNVEVIVVDDGSSDNSREIIASYGDKISSVLKENGGQASALNVGFRVSHGEIVFFLDVDDYLFPTTAEQVVTAWEPGVAKVQYLLRIVDAFGNSLGIYPPCERPLDDGEVWSILLEKGRYGTPVTSGNGFSRAVLEKIFPIPEAEFRIASDGYLVTLVPFYGQVVSIKQALGAYRIHGSNLWALAKNVEVKKLCKFVQHDLQRYQLLADKATELGNTLPKNLSYRDHDHLKRRIASLRLNLQNHPLPYDSSLVLIYRGIRAVWQYSDVDLQKRLLLSMWFIWVGLLPLQRVNPGITWLLVPESRPRGLDWILNLFSSSFAMPKFSS